MKDKTIFILIVLVLGVFVLNSFSPGLFSLTRVEGTNKFEFDFSDSVLAGGRGIIVGNSDEFNLVRQNFTAASSKPGILIGKDSFSLKLVQWPLESPVCLQSFLKDTASRQTSLGISGFSDWQVPSSCLLPATIEYNQYSESGLGQKVRKDLKVGESVKINPCMSVKLKSASLSREFKSPNIDPDMVKAVFELSVDDYSCLSISGLDSTGVFKLGGDGNRQVSVVNKLYPRLESFVDYRSINKGLEAEQTTQVYNNPYVVLDKMNSNSISVPLDNTLLGDREDQLYYGFYLRSEDGSILAVYDNERLDSTYLVNEKGVSSAPVTVSVPVGEQIVSVNEPSVQPVKKGVSTGFVLGGVGLLLLVVFGVWFLFFSRYGKNLKSKLFGK